MLLTRKRFSGLLLTSLLCLATAATAMAQDHPAGPPQGPPMEHSFHEGHGRWWDNPKLANEIDLKDAQKKQMDDIFAKHRQQLTDLKAKLDADEHAMRPMIEADHPDKKQILKQIDTIAQARANLEKANARMLLGIRGVLTQDQWKSLRTIVQKHRHDWGPRPCGEWHGHGPHGPNAPNGPEGQPGAPPPGQ